MKRIIFAGLLLVGVMSCSVENEVPANYDTEGIKTLDLAADIAVVKHDFGPAGYVEAWTDTEYLKIRFVANETTNKTHKLLNSRVHIVENPADFPKNEGGFLPPGQMDNVVHHGGGVSSYTYSFDKNLYGDCVYIAPWAIFNAGGPDTQHFAGDILGGNDKKDKWWYFKLGICTTVVQNVCNSAYMLSETPNSQFPTTLNSYYNEKPTNVNWGWYQLYDEAVFGESYTFDVWAGAGQNVLEKGMIVASIQVSIDSDGKVLTNLDVDPGFAYDLHVFVADILPTKRPAPGKFTNTGDKWSYDYSTKPPRYLNGSRDGKFVIIVHAKACWNTISN
jgi:hypothetical protein